MILVRFFVYGTMLPGEPHHADLEGARSLGPCRTRKGYALVELAAMAGLIEEGEGSAVGELYELAPGILMQLVQQPRHPGFFQLRPVELEDGSHAESFMLETDQARGKRRIREGDWRTRFAPRPPGILHDAGPLVTWARDRHRR